MKQDAGKDGKSNDGLNGFSLVYAQILKDKK